VELVSCFSRKTPLLGISSDCYIDPARTVTLLISVMVLIFFVVSRFIFSALWVCYGNSVRCFTFTMLRREQPRKHFCVAVDFRTVTLLISVMVLIFFVVSRFIFSALWPCYGNSV